MADNSPVSLTQDGYAAVLAALGKPSTFIDITADAKKIRNGTHKSYSTVSSVSADKFWTERGAKTDRTRYEFVAGAQLAGEPADLAQVLRTAHLWLGIDEDSATTAAIERSRDPEYIVERLNSAYGLGWDVLTAANASAGGEKRDILDGLKTPAAKRYAKKTDMPARPVQELAAFADLKKVAVRVGRREPDLRNLTLVSGTKKVVKKDKKKDTKKSITYMTKLDASISCSVRSPSPSPKQQKRRSPARKTKSPTRSSSSSTRVSLRSSEEEPAIRVIEEVDDDTGAVLGYFYEDDPEVAVPRSVSRNRLQIVKRVRVQQEEEEEDRSL